VVVVVGGGAVALGLSVVAGVVQDSVAGGA